MSIREITKMFLLCDMPKCDNVAISPCIICGADLCDTHSVEMRLPGSSLGSLRFLVCCNHNAEHLGSIRSYLTAERHKFIWDSFYTKRALSDRGPMQV